MKKSPPKVILVIDDDVDFLEEIQSLLSEKDYNVVTCSDSEQVMLMIGDYVPNLILLDLAMPSMRGEDLLPIIRAKHPEIPVIICTGLPESELQFLYRAGAKAIFQKPFSYNAFLRTLEKAA